MFFFLIMRYRTGDSAECPLGFTIARMGNISTPASVEAPVFTPGRQQAMGGDIKTVVPVDHDR